MKSTTSTTFSIPGVDLDFRSLAAALSHAHYMFRDNDDGDEIVIPIFNDTGVVIAVVTDDANGITNHVF